MRERRKEIKKTLVQRVLCLSFSFFSLSLSLSLSLMRAYRDYKETLPPKKITVAFSFVCKKKSLILWAISYLFFSSKVTYTRGTHKYTQTVMLTHYSPLRGWLPSVNLGHRWQAEPNKMLFLIDCQNYQVVDSVWMRILMIVDNSFLSIVCRTGGVRIYVRTYKRNLCT